MPSSQTDNLSLEKQATGENDGSWGTLLNAVLDQIDTAIAGVLSKSCAGSSNVTLTSTEALNAVHITTGLLTGNISYIVPSEEKVYIVFNNTTGAYTLTVKTAAGTGIAVTQGQKAVLYCDATNVVKVIATDDSLQDIVEDTSPQLGGALDTNAFAVNFSEGAAVASITQPNIWAADGNTLHITGSTQIDDFTDAPRIGAWRWLVFDGALQITHGSGITVSGAASFTTAAGDIAFVYADAVDAFRLFVVGNASLGTLYAGTSGQLLRHNGTKWTGSSELTVLAAMRGHIGGFGMSNAADADHDITIAAGAAVAADVSALLVGSAITKQIDAAWAVGTNAGGLDTGAVGNTTWYHVWVIRRSDTGVVDALFSTSATAPTMPASYDQKRRIGAVLTNGSANIIGFVQSGDTFWWKSPVLNINNATPGTAANTATLTVPTGVRCLAYMNVSDAAGAVLYLSPTDVTDEAPSQTSAPLGVNGNGAGGSNQGSATVLTNTSAQIRYRASANTAVYGATLGWQDARGRDD